MLTEPLSPNSITYGLIQKVPESMRETAAKVSAFVQNMNPFIVAAATVATIFFPPPISFTAAFITTGILLLTVVGLRAARQFLPQEASDAVKPLTNMEVVDKSLLIMASAVASVVTANPIFISIGVKILSAHQCCDLCQRAYVRISDKLGELNYVQKMYLMI